MRLKDLSLNNFLWRKQRKSFGSDFVGDGQPTRTRVGYLLHDGEDYGTEVPSSERDGEKKKPPLAERQLPGADK